MVTTQAFAYFEQWAKEDAFYYLLGLFQSTQQKYCILAKRMVPYLTVKKFFVGFWPSTFKHHFAF